MYILLGIRGNITSSIKIVRIKKCATGSDRPCQRYDD